MEVRMKRQNIDRVIRWLISAMLLIGAFHIGTTVGLASSRARTATTTKNEVNTGLRPTVVSRGGESTTTFFVEKPVIVIEYVETVRRLPVKIRSFESLTELEKWLEGVFLKAGMFYFESPTNTIDCDDYAVSLQQTAISDGFLVSLEVTETGEYNRLFKKSQLPPGTLHAINLVVIGNEAYYIEPQTGEIVLAAYLD